LVSKDNEFVRLAKSVMKMNNYTFPEAAEQLILAGRGPGNFIQTNRKKEKKNGL